MDKITAPALPYSLDPRSNVWFRPGTYSGAPSTDGAVEFVDRLIRNARDVTCGSEELLAAAVDWPTQYYVGPERYNILRPVRRFLQGRILEIGSECGALTRFLGETESEVVAFEADVCKATVAAERCRGLSNVKVFCDRFARATVCGPFKVIALIGALEYSAHPEELLERCNSLLADDGFLLVAVENKLALKNFAGAPEEHTGGIFHGVTGLDTTSAGRSYGRRELIEQLRDAGLTHCEFLYPLPNYRFARMVLYPDAFQITRGGITTDLVQRFSTFYDPRWNYERLFSERRAWATILRNELGEDFAPSYLVLASKQSQPLLQPDILGHSYSTARRRCFQKENTLLRKTGKLFFCCSKLYDAEPPAGGSCWQELREEQLQEGRLWANELHARLDKPGWTFQTILDWFRPYFEFLLEYGDWSDGRTVLPANFLDCTPFNVIRKRDGTFVSFDLEWVSQRPVPLDFLLFRGLFYTLNETITVSRPDYIEDSHVLNIILRLMASVGLPIDEKRLAELFELEEKQQKCAAGDHATILRTYWRNACLTPRLENVREELTRRDIMLEQVSQKLQTRDAEHVAIQRQLEDRDLKIAFLDEQAAKLEARVEELVRDVFRYKQTILATKDELASLRNENQSLSTTLAEASQQLHERDDDVVSLRNETQALSTALAETSQQLEQRNESLDHLASHAAELTSQLRAEGDKRLQFEIRAARLASEHRQSRASAAQQLKRLEHEVEGIRASWSWRLTLPLRSLVDLLKYLSKPAVYAGVRLRFAWLCRSTERRRAVVSIRENCVFDNEFYTLRGADVEKSRIPPLIHYFLWGAAEGRNPHPWFDTAFYRRQCGGLDLGGMTPLEHYLLRGWKEGKDPNPLFKSSIYLQQNPDVARSGMNPFVHYLMHGRKEGRCPDLALREGIPVDGGTNLEGKISSLQKSPEQTQAEIEAIQRFFDVAFYRRQCSELELDDKTPYEHYLKSGAAKGLDPHPLFDTSFYVDNNPDVVRAGLNPLLHFAIYGGKEGRDPHALFDSSFYLETYRDIAKAGLNPLLHYLQNGALEGRCPNPLFDGGFYMRSNPDVASSGANPLVHFIQSGATERRNPHPAFDMDHYLRQHPDVAISGINPLIHYLRFDGVKPRSIATPALVAAASKPFRPAACFSVKALGGFKEGPPTFRPARTVLCVTHVPPYPPRAGNEYAEYRKLDYLERHGYRTVIVLSPLPGEELSSEQFGRICDRFPYTILCGRDGVVQHRLPEGDAILNALDGVALNSFESLLGEEQTDDPRELWLINTERTFCHDFLARLAIHLEAALSPCILLSMYIFQTRFLRLIKEKSLKVVDTIDMFSTAQRKVVKFGVKETLNLTAEQERARLLRAHLILACQHAEAEEFTALVPERRVLEVPFDFDVLEETMPPVSSNILYVASDNPLNTKGLRDFLRLAWPVILKEAPEARLLVAGKICRTVERPPDGVQLLGMVDDLKLLYEQAKLTINPAVAGTGMKIKTAESMSHLRPVVGWPAGVDGFPPELANLCLTARDWPQFADHVLSILRSPNQDWFSAEQKNAIRNLLSPDTSYRALLHLLDTYSEQHGLARFNGMAIAKDGGE